MLICLYSPQLDHYGDSFEAVEGKEESQRTVPYRENPSCHEQMSVETEMSKAILMSIVSGQRSQLTCSVAAFGGSGVFGRQKWVIN